MGVISDPPRQAKNMRGVEDINWGVKSPPPAISTLLVQRWRGSSGNVRLSNLLISSCFFIIGQVEPATEYE